MRTPGQATAPMRDQGYGDVTAWMDAPDPYADLLMMARARYDEALEHDKPERDARERDLNMIAGDQWDPDALAERINAGRPVPVINRVAQVPRQVANDVRLNPPSIKASPAGGGADQETAEVIADSIRRIEQRSASRQPYVGATEIAAQCGMGHFRIDVDFEDDESFELDAFMACIEDPFAVLWDPQSRTVTREDARFCFVAVDMARDVFEAEYPDAAPSDFDWDTRDHAAESWRGDDTVRVVEYWVKEPVRALIAELADGRMIRLDQAAQVIEAPQGLFVVPQAGGQAIPVRQARAVETHKVMMYRLSGDAVLGEPYEWPTPHIPIIPVIAERVRLQGREMQVSTIRHAHDAQRLLNWNVATMIEHVAQQPKAPYLVTEMMIAGYEDDWAAANDDVVPYLLYNPDEDAPGGVPQRQAPPALSQAYVTQIAMGEDMIKSTTGVYDAALGARSNETSGVAITARQRESDVSTYHIIDNLRASVMHAGRILLALMRRLYTVERVKRIVGEDGTDREVRLGPEPPEQRMARLVAEREGRSIPPEQRIFDLNVGRYDMTVSTGPSYSTRREENRQAMAAFMDNNPHAAILMDYFAREHDFAYADEMAERIQKVLPAEVRDDDGPPEPPDPAQQQAMALQQRQGMLAMAKLEAEVEAERAKAEKLRAEAMETALGLTNEEIALIQALRAGAFGSGGAAPFMTEPF